VTGNYHARFWSRGQGSDASLDYNAVCGGNWSVTCKPWRTSVICELNIYGLTRSSAGQAEGSPKGVAGTAAEAQAFKRACSKFGLGRHLYGLPSPYVAYDAQRKRLLEVPKLKASTR
jgi:hypothetical protein